MHYDGPKNICHVMTADLWAGAEVQLATTASYLVERPALRALRQWYRTRGAVVGP